MEQCVMKRRDFLKASALSAAAAALLPRTLLGQDGGKKPARIALQLYSLREDSKKDFDAVLTEVSKLGVAGVEFAGYHRYGGKAKELRQRLDDLGLVAAGTHIGTGSFRGDALQRTIDFHQALGCKYLIVPSDRDFTNPEKWRTLAELFNATAEKLKPLGMACGYHNHTAEFKQHEGKSFFELFADNTSADVVLQQDCGWTFHAGQDPVALIKKYPGRFGTVHIKPMVRGGDAGKRAIIGQDSVPWADVVAACNQFGGTEWLTIEQESYSGGKSPLDCVKESVAGLKAIVAG
ncbi:MAG: sugar phosphate isomerase/epimerase [Lentisphaerae bacterium]|nr:sugar phosphate isomerase/epimerase [Lentisphaerota bacterium]